MAGVILREGPSPNSHLGELLQTLTKSLLQSQISPWPGREVYWDLSG